MAVVGPMDNQKDPSNDTLVSVAQNLGLLTLSDEELYDILQKSKKIGDKSLDEIDLVISYLFWKKIKKPLIDLPRIGCINFHSAPLPEFRGVNGYSFAIFQDLPYWGVSAHFVDESIDSGDIIEVIKFEIDPKNETSFSLEQKSQVFLLELFKKVITNALSNNSLPRSSQHNGKYYSKTDFEKLRKINPQDTLEEIEKKIRAFWYPPYGGAYIELHGKEFTIIDEKLLAEIGVKYKK